MKAILLAAGLGTRLRPLTDTTPKCLMPLDGVPLLGLWLDRLAAAGVSEFLVNTHYLAPQVEAFVAQHRLRDRITLLHEEVLLGTAGTVRAAQHFWQQETEVLVVHADNYAQVDMAAFIAAHHKRPSHCLMSMMLFTSETPQQCGIVEQDTAGVITAFHEKVAHPPGTLANAAIYVMTTELLRSMTDETDLSTQVIPQYLGRIYGWHHRGVMLDIGTPQAYEKAQHIAAQRHAIVVGVSSDIGLALAADWHASGWQCSGTFRQKNTALQQCGIPFTHLSPCDVGDAASIDACAEHFVQQHAVWDALVLCPGLLTPIGRFDDCDMEAWAQSLMVNFTGQLRMVQRLLRLRRYGGTALPLVLFFAGGGTNSAPVNFSAYTLSKIALIKAAELLDAEFPDLRVAILGPGWVETKIHAQTLAAGDAASAGSAGETARRLESGDFVPMETVLSACRWLRDASKALVGGRNFSAAHDFKDIAALEAALMADPARYKLRRWGN